MPLIIICPNCKKHFTLSDEERKVFWAMSKEDREKVTCSNCRSTRKEKVRPAATPEPAPTGNRKIVLYEVIKDHVARAANGREKYGTFLKTNNGRNALMDLYQELQDSVMYCKQILMEQDETGTPFRTIVKDQLDFSSVIFGPGCNTNRLIDHIKKELVEVKESNGKDLTEWIDIIILAIDGAWRNGYNPKQIEQALLDKQVENRNRQWPDWRTAEPDKAIEHIKN